MSRISIDMTAFTSLQEIRFLVVKPAESVTMSNIKRKHVLIRLIQMPATASQFDVPAWALLAHQETSAKFYIPALFPNLVT